MIMCADIDLLLLLLLLFLFTPLKKVLRALKIWKSRAPIWVFKMCEDLQIFNVRGPNMT